MKCYTDQMAANTNEFQTPVKLGVIEREFLFK